MKSRTCEIERAMKGNEQMLVKYQADLSTLRAGGFVPNLSIDGAEQMISGLRAAIDNCRHLLALGRTRFQ